LDIYRFSRRFPVEELQGITGQLRSTASALTAHLSDALKQQHPGEKIRSYQAAEGKLSACRSYLQLARDLGYGKNETLQQEAEALEHQLKEHLSILKNGLGMTFS
jgi:four helix bundle protein